MTAELICLHSNRRVCTPAAALFRFGGAGPEPSQKNAHDSCFCLMAEHVAAIWQCSAGGTGSRAQRENTVFGLAFFSGFIEIRTFKTYLCE